MKKFAVITISIIAFLGIALLGVQWWAAKKIKSAIDNVSIERPEGKYLLSAGKVRVNLLNRSLHIKNVFVKADTSGLNDESMPPMLVDFSLGKIRVQGVSLRSLLRKDSDITAKHIQLISPELTITSYVNSKADSVKIHDSIKTHEKNLVRSLHKGPKIFVSNVHINDGFFEFRRKKNDDYESFIVEDFNLCAGGFSTDTTVNRDKKLKYLHGLKVFIGKATYIPLDGSVMLSADSLGLDTNDEKIHIGKIKLAPQLPKEQFAELTEKHSDWTDIEADGVRCYGVDFETLVKDKLLKIDSVCLKDTRVATYKNRNVDQPQVIKHLFYEAVQAIPLNLAIRRTHILNVDVTYEELARGASKPGIITFTGLNGDIKGLTNIIDPDKPYYTLEANGKLYGTGDLSAVFHLPIDPKTNHFDITGKLGTIDMKYFNQMTQPLAKLELVSGVIQNMKFRISGSSTKSESEVTLLYKDLDVLLVKNKRGRLKERKVLSWIVNEMIIRDKNPDDKGTRTSHGSAERNFNKSQFNYIWKSLQPSIMQTIGIPDKNKQKQAKNKKQKQK